MLLPRNGFHGENDDQSLDLEVLSGPKHTDHVHSGNLNIFNIAIEHGHLVR